MSKEKRTYHDEVLMVSALELKPVQQLDQKQPDPSKQKAAQKEIFSPEVISRLTERIKKL